MENNVVHCLLINVSFSTCNMAYMHLNLNKDLQLKDTLDKTSRNVVCIPKTCIYNIQHTHYISYYDMSNVEPQRFSIERPSDADFVLEDCGFLSCSCSSSCWCGTIHLNLSASGALLHSHTRYREPPPQPFGISYRLAVLSKKIWHNLEICALWVQWRAFALKMDRFSKHGSLEKYCVCFSASIIFLHGRYSI